MDLQGFRDRAEAEAFHVREYQPSLLIDDPEGIRQRWWQMSEAARREQACVLDVRYGPGERELLDVFPAQAPSPAALVFIHGGYWRSLDRRWFSFLARSFNDMGASCFMPSYGLAPQTPMEDIVAQAAASVRWVHENAARYGADPGRLVVVGHSAGAHLLATILAGRAPGLDAMPEDWIRGALAISGVYDLRPLLLVPFLNADLQLTAEQAEALSPALSRPAGRTPLWTSVGGIEPGEFHRQTRLLEQQWPEVWTGAIEMPASNHLSILDELAVRGSPLNEALANMVDGTR